MGGMRTYFVFLAPPGLAVEIAVWREARLASCGVGGWVGLGGFGWVWVGGWVDGWDELPTNCRRMRRA